jgi:hypothetical protein
VIESATSLPTTGAQADISDEEVVLCVRAGDVALYGVLMRRYNQLVSSRGRSCATSEIEDILQEAYLAAYRNLADSRDVRASRPGWFDRGEQGTRPPQAAPPVVALATRRTA